MHWVPRMMQWLAAESATALDLQSVNSTAECLVRWMAAYLAAPTDCCLVEHWVKRLAQHLATSSVSRSEERRVGKVGSATASATVMNWVQRMMQWLAAESATALDLQSVNST